VLLGGFHDVVDDENLVQTEERWQWSFYPSVWNSHLVRLSGRTDHRIVKTALILA